MPNTVRHLLPAALTWMRTVPTKRLSLLLFSFPPALPENPIFFQLTAMADCAPTARVPASALRRAKVTTSEASRKEGCIYGVRIVRG